MMGHVIDVRSPEKKANGKHPGHVTCTFPPLTIDEIEMLIEGVERSRRLYVLIVADDEVVLHYYVTGGHPSDIYRWAARIGLPKLATELEVHKDEYFDRENICDHSSTTANCDLTNDEKRGLAREAYNARKAL